MSQNSIVNPRIEEALRKQKATATISSLLVSILAIVLVGLVLFFLAIKSIEIVQPDLVTYKASSQQDDELEKREINPTRQRRPSAPSSSMAKVIAANTTSPTAIPVPEIDSPVESVEFGGGDDFGAGWGSGSGGSGKGGGTSFFGQKSEAERIAFVIDYSASMGGERVKLMKEELSKSLEQLQPGTEFQMIFFAGPVWVAGSEVLHLNGEESKQGNSVTAPDGTVYKWKSNGGASSFEPKGKVQKAEWLKVPSLDEMIGARKREARSKGKDILARSREIVQETPLVYGTRWKYALEMALDMEPRPEVIYFMTDGSTGKEAMEVAEKVGRRGKNRGIIINCIAMMEPRAHDAMKEMSKRTGGEFTVVEKGGKSVVVPLD